MCCKKPKSDRLFPHFFVDGVVRRGALRSHSGLQERFPAKRRLFTVAPATAAKFEHRLRALPLAHRPANVGAPNPWAADKRIYRRYPDAACKSAARMRIQRSSVMNPEPQTA